MPEESTFQTRVWVAFAASAAIWGRDYKEVQATIGRLVQAMVPYTQVNVLCREAEQALARRRREVSWALRQLGRSEASSAYDAKGQAHLLHTRKPLAVA